MITHVPSLALILHIASSMAALSRACSGIGNVLELAGLLCVYVSSPLLVIGLLAHHGQALGDDVRGFLDLGKTITVGQWAPAPAGHKHTTRYTVTCTSYAIPM